MLLHDLLRSAFRHEEVLAQLLYLLLSEVLLVGLEHLHVVIQQVAA